MPTVRQRLTPWAALTATVLVAVAFAYVIARPHDEPMPVVAGLAPGDKAPDFTLSGLDGVPVTLSALKGHPVVLDFWATWCPPCVEELPTVTSVAAKYAPQGVKFYAVNVSEVPAEIRAFLDRHKLDTPVLVGGDSETPLKYAADYLPLLVVIDADGKLVARANVNPDEAEKTLTDWIEKALKTGQAA